MAGHFVLFKPHTTKRGVNRILAHAEGGLLVQARGNSWGRLIFKDLVKFG